MKKEQLLTLTYVRQILDYDPSTGIIRWKITRNSYRGQVRPGSPAGTIDRYGHRYIRIDGKNYMAHRVAWFHYYGFWPKGEVDHKNMVQDDNRIENLRDVGPNRSLQRANQRVRKDSKTGIKGVQRTKNGKYVARLARRWLGVYSTPEEAHAAYMSAAIRLFGDFARAA